MFINTIKVFDQEAIAGSGNIESDVIELHKYKPEGFFSIQLTTVGTSSQVKVEYLLSLDGVTYVDCGTDIVTGFTPSTNIYAFPTGEPVIAPYMKFKVTETAGNDVSSCTLTFCIQ